MKITYMFSAILSMVLTQPVLAAPLPDPAAEAAAWWTPDPTNAAAEKIEAPTFANVKYGSHVRQGMDVWLPKDAKGPVPCIVYIHGGAWVGGSRVDWNLRKEVLPLCKKEGFALVSISYRMITSGGVAEGVRPPVKAPVGDAISAVKYVIGHAAKWKIDPKRIGLTGGSAGACSTLIASLSNDNELGVRAVLARIPQTTLDPKEVLEWIPNGYYGAHAFGYNYAGFKEFLANREKHLDDIEKYSPAALARRITPGKAPVILYKCGKPGTREKDSAHAPEYCVRFEEICRARGIDCRRGGYGDFVTALKTGRAIPGVPGFELGPWRLPGTGRIEGDILTISVPPDAPKGHNKAMAKIHLRPYLGKELHLTMKVRVRNLVRPNMRFHWLGPKFMVMYRDEFRGEMKYPDVKFPCEGGDFEGELTLIAPLYGVEADYGDLCLGLESASGEISFDLSTLRVSAEQTLFPPKNAGRKVKYPKRVAKRPPLRGAMIRPDLKEQDVADLASWGARLMRFQIFEVPEKGYDKEKATTAEVVAKFRRDVAVHLDYLESNVLGWARKYGMMVVVDMHMVPAGQKVSSGFRASVQDDDELFGVFCDEWKKIAERLKGNEDVIYGYDIVNEPGQNRPQKYGYFGLQERIAKEIRKIDPKTTIVVESSNACSPDAYSYMNALDIDNVIYQVHVYQPMSYTHQGLRNGGSSSPYPQPATASSLAVDKEYLRKVVAPVRKFQKEHGCRIYVGEFSAVAWAEGAAQYLDDLISIFEEYGWDWTYHAFREASLWSVEHEATDFSHRWKAKEDTDRKKVLLKYFSKAKKQR